MDSMITLPEAAHRCGLTWPSAHKAAMRGDFGAIQRVAGRWLIPLAGVEAYLQRRAQQRASAVPPPVAD